MLARMVFNVVGLMMMTMILVSFLLAGLFLWSLISFLCGMICFLFGEVIEDNIEIRELKTRLKRFKGKT